MEKCNACTRNDHAHCESVRLALCSCWRTWHGGNPPVKRKATTTTKKGRK